MKKALMDGIYPVTNVSVWISIYIQMLILVRVAFSFSRIQTIQFHHKKMDKHSKTGILIKVTWKFGNYCKQLMDSKFEKCLCECLHWHNSPPSVMCERSHWHNAPPSSSHTFPLWWTALLPLSANTITECSHNTITECPHSIFRRDTQNVNFIKHNIIQKLVCKVKYIS